MERRQHARLSGPFDGSWRGAAGNGLCRISDLGLGGCFVQTLAAPSIGEETLITLTAAEQTLTLSGRVLYVEPVIGFAVQFADLEPHELRKFQQVLDTLSAQRPG